MAGRPPKPNQVRLTIYLPKEIADEIRKAASDSDKTLGDIVIEAFACTIRRTR